MSITYLDRALFQSPYRYALCTSEESFEKELKRLRIPPRDWPRFLSTSHAHATVHYFENKASGFYAVVCLGSMKGRHVCEIVGLLTHEAVHIWQTVRDHIGEKNPGSEQEAYAVQWLVQQLVGAAADQIPALKFLNKTLP